MTQQEKIRHLLRRFGLGASTAEVAEYEKLGIEGAIKRLIEYEEVEEGFNVSPWEFCFEEGNNQFYFDSFRPVSWWSLRFLVTKRPLQEKLTLFWHDHFAVSGTKVEAGPMMLEYNRTLREHATGRFDDLLEAVSKDPAMMFYLDMHQSTKSQPNENFAREVMELFTLGIGNYSEQDIKEAARAFTGWGIRYLLYESGGENIQQRALEAISRNEPMFAYCFTPDLSDDGEKTILGKKGHFSGEQVLSMLAGRPESAKHLATKLWSFFAYPDPEPAVVERLAKAYMESGHSIKAMLYAIARSDEFWSERAVRAIIKSPADFVVPIARQFQLRDIVMSLRGNPPTPTTPARKELRDAAGLIGGTMFQQGMLLLFPPDVGGWEWGKAWITSNNMLERAKLADLLFNPGAGDYPLAAFLAARIVQELKPTNAEQTVNAVLTVFDADVTADQRQVLVQACEKEGGAGALAKPATAAKMLSSICRVLFVAPEFNFC